MIRSCQTHTVFFLSIKRSGAQIYHKIAFVRQLSSYIHYEFMPNYATARTSKEIVKTLGKLVIKEQILESKSDRIKVSSYNEMQTLGF